MKKTTKKYWVMPRNEQYVQETSAADMDAMTRPFASFKKACKVASEIAAKGVHPDGRIPFGYVVVTNSVDNPDDFIQWNHENYDVVTGYACNSIRQPEIQAEVVSFNTYYNPVTNTEEMSACDTDWCFTDKLSALKYLKKEWNNFYSNEIGVEIFDEIIFATDFRYDDRTWEVDGKSFKSKGDAVIYCMENCLSIRAITEK